MKISERYNAEILKAITYYSKSNCNGCGVYEYGECPRNACMYDDKGEAIRAYFTGLIKNEELKKAKKQINRLRLLIVLTHKRLSGDKGWTNSVVQEVMLDLRSWVKRWETK